MLVETALKVLPSEPPSEVIAAIAAI